MWISRKEFNELRKEVNNLRTESNSRYRLLLDLNARLKREIPDMVNEEIGIKVIECVKDNIKLEVFNKLKDKLFSDE